MFDAIINYAGIARKVGSGVPHLSGSDDKRSFFITLLKVSFFRTQDSFFKSPKKIIPENYPELEI